MENVRGKNTKRKHLSKNKKKSWRKVDITDVEEFLEDERHQERTGGKLSEKKDDALFMLDSSKAKLGRKAIQKARDRKRKAQDALDDVEVALKPPPAAKKDRRPKAMIDRLVNRDLPTRFAIAKEQRKASKIENIKKYKERPRTTAATYDLWAADNKLDQELVNEDPHFLTVTRKRRVKVPVHLQNKPSKLPAVEFPHPGTSYNPAFDEYKDLIYVANSKEEKKLRLEEKIHNALHAKFPTADEAPTEASRLKEMSAGLFEEDEEEDDQDSGSGGEMDEDLDKLSVNPPVSRENKKDLRQRKKQKHRQDMEKKLIEEKQKRIRDNEFFRLKGIKKEIKAKELKIQEKKARKEKEKMMEPYTTRRLGKTKFEEADLEVKLSDELVGSLREVKPEGDLLEDRMNSLQKRNLIEPRVRQFKKKNRRIKYVEKRKHRDIQN